MSVSGVLSTIFTGTILATGKTFTHGLGTLPDMVQVQPETNASATNGAPYHVTTFGTQTCTIGGPVDASAVRVLVQRLHSIIG